MEHEGRIRWFAREVLPHEGDVRRWLASRIRGLAMCDLDEVVQETYARLWAADTDRIQDARAYMFVTARRVVGEIVRRSRIVPIETVADIDTLNVADAGPTPERRLSGREEVERLRSAIAALPAKCREAFLLKKFELLSQREISVRMSISESTVEKHLARALRTIMQEMDRTPDHPARSRGRNERRQRQR